MGCLELVADRATKAAFPRGAKQMTQVAREAYQRGAMIRTSGANIILSPALTIERAQIDLLCDALDASLTAVEA
jgi:adenosylmethionine-8-amino-7-oxononanoate aminotransferase